MPTDAAAGDGDEERGAPGAVRLPNDDHTVSALAAEDKSKLYTIGDDRHGMNVRQQRLRDLRNLQLLKLLQHFVGGLDRAVFIGTGGCWYSPGQKAEASKQQKEKASQAIHRRLHSLALGVAVRFTALLYGASGNVVLTSGHHNVS